MLGARTSLGGQAIVGWRSRRRLQRHRAAAITAKSTENNSAAEVVLPYQVEVGAVAMKRQPPIAAERGRRPADPRREDSRPGTDEPATADEIQQ